MGIPRMFQWCCKTLPETIYNINPTETMNTLNIRVDTLMLDLNGIFHSSAQQIYEYGDHKKPPRLIGVRAPKDPKLQRTLLCKHICETIDYIFRTANPSQNLVLCIDGPSPLAKQNQQRQRRYRNAINPQVETFDISSISPGTVLMDQLSRYIDWFIRYKITKDPNWKKIRVIFSNDKTPGEGEHKLINYIRKYGTENEVYCLHGADADLIMLALATHKPNFYILRDSNFDPNIRFNIIDIGMLRCKLNSRLLFNRIEYNIRDSINDFVFFCFILGNDFLPHIPGIEIIENGIDIMLNLYKDSCEKYGHLTRNEGGYIHLNIPPLREFLSRIADQEKSILEKKISKRASFFPDELLDKHTRILHNTSGTVPVYDIDIDKYREEYIATLFPFGTSISDTNIRNICHAYIEGMQWVLTYYTTGINNWNWFYPYHYAPFAFHLAKHIDTYNQPVYPVTKPSTPFLQLLSVLPPTNANLLPEPFSGILMRDLATIDIESIKIDLSGKRKDWEGIVLIPFVDQKLVKKLYSDNIGRVSQSDLHRNTINKSVLYTYDPDMEYNFTSFCSTIKGCRANQSIIDI